MDACISLKYTVGKTLWTNVWVGTLHTHNPAETSAKASVGRNPYDSAPCREPSWFPSKHKLLFADREMTTPPGQPWPVAQCCRGWIRGEGAVWQRCFLLIAAKKTLAPFLLFSLLTAVWTSSNWTGYLNCRTLWCYHRDYEGNLGGKQQWKLKRY